VIRRLALMTLVTAALILPASLMAQPASPTETELQMRRQQRRAIVRPTPPSAIVERDVQAATADAAQRLAQDEVVRELRRPFTRRPDLDYDVKSGIQSQRLNDALRR
jgi:hypothetical protein